MTTFQYVIIAIGVGGFAVIMALPWIKSKFSSSSSAKIMTSAQAIDVIAVDVVLHCAKPDRDICLPAIDTLRGVLDKGKA